MIQEAKKTTLSEEDIEMVKYVYDLTDQPGFNPIITFKGPETDHLFDNQDFTHMVTLGQEKRVSASAAAGSGKPVVMHRHVIRLFEGSEVFPEGIPVGAWDCYLPTVADDSNNRYFYHDTKRDITSREYERLYSLAHGYERMSDAERKADEKAKLRMRRQKGSPDQSNALGALGEIIAAAIAQNEQKTQEKRVRKTRKTATVATESEE